MECVVVQDLFLNETANYAHVFLPGSSFLEKDGTFTNAERRISRVRKVMPPLAGLRPTGRSRMVLVERARLPDGTTRIPSRSWTRSRALTPTFAGVSYEKLDELGSHPVAVQRRRRRTGTPIMHVDGFVRGKGRFVITEYVPTDGAHRRALPAAPDHRPHPLASTTSARRRGAPTTSRWHDEDVLEIHPHDAENRGIGDGDLVALAEPRRRDRAARA